MIYIYRRRSSSGARALSEAVSGRRVRDLQRFRIGPTDTIVSWGEAVAGENVLNGAPIRDKFTDAEMLKAAGVPTIEVSRTRPPDPPAGPDPLIAAHEHACAVLDGFVDIRNPYRGAVYIAGVRDIQEAFLHLYDVLNEPLPVAGPAVEWIGRSSNHVGGNDLLNPPAQPDYFVKKENLINEFRVHSFDGVSIRAGIKRGREDVNAPHQWIRSWDGGWRISYDGVTIRQHHRDLAARAVEALGLTFGAVDIGQKANGSCIVLEVNRAPGLEGGTVTAYANAIRRWVEEE